MAHRRTKSDEYKAVRIYREKIASIQDGVAQTISELDKSLGDYLKEFSIPPPPNNPDPDMSGR